jgi:SAM-dependent methyltransferase
MGGASARLRAVARRVLPQPIRAMLRRAMKSLSRPAPLVAPAPGPTRGTSLAGDPTLTSYVPRDHARQVHPRYYLKEAMTAPDAADLVVDLGCGAGASAAHIRAWKPDVQWIGVDLEASELARAIEGETVMLYDGLHLPLATDSVPLIYSNQVFEHVRYPDQLLAEVRRVLVPGGLFVGSTSQMEPYHARSIWGGYTLFGWRTLCSEAGLVLEEARPSIDAVALITRQYSGPPAGTSPWVSSPLNEEIDRWAAETGADVFATNARKLQFCGQFAFRVRKPVTTA